MINIQSKLPVTASDKLETEIAFPGSYPKSYAFLRLITAASFVCYYWIAPQGVKDTKFKWLDHESVYIGVGVVSAVINAMLGSLIPEKFSKALKKASGELRLARPSRLKFTGVILKDMTFLMAALWGASPVYYAAQESMPGTSNARFLVMYAGLSARFVTLWTSLLTLAESKNEFKVALDSTIHSQKNTAIKILFGLLIFYVSCAALFYSLSQYEKLGQTLDKLSGVNKTSSTVTALSSAFSLVISPFYIMWALIGFNKVCGGIAGERKLAFAVLLAILPTMFPAIVLGTEGTCNANITCTEYEKFWSDLNTVGIETAIAFTVALLMNFGSTFIFANQVIDAVQGCCNRDKLDETQPLLEDDQLGMTAT